MLSRGHYARKTWSSTGTPRPQLVRAIDRHKDQTYYLSGVSEAALAKALFPLGELTKTEVRALAVKYDLPTASRGESMGICFVGEKRRFSDFLGKDLSRTLFCSSSVTVYSRSRVHQAEPRSNRGRDFWSPNRNSSRPMVLYNW